MGGRIIWFLADARWKLAWQVNHNKRFHDFAHLRFFNEKSTHLQFNHPAAYNFWLTAVFGMGLFFGAGIRTGLCSPDFVARRSEYYKPWPDKHYSFTWSLPFYNHWLRSRISKFRNSFVDNEPDWLSYHPWGHRPDRNLSYARIPGGFSEFRYLLDAPNAERNLTDNMERLYTELGYSDNPEAKKISRRHAKMVREGRHAELLRENPILCYKYPMRPGPEAEALQKELAGKLPGAHRTGPAWFT